MGVLAQVSPTTAMLAMSFLGAVVEYASPMVHGVGVPHGVYLVSWAQGYTVWPEILAGNLFWRIGDFESNPPIFHPPKLYSVLSSIFVS